MSSLLSWPSWLAAERLEVETTRANGECSDWRSHEGLFQLVCGFLDELFTSDWFRTLLPRQGSKTGETKKNIRNRKSSLKRPLWLRHSHVWSPVPVVSWLKSCPSHEGLVKRLTYVQSIAVY